MAVCPDHNLYHITLTVCPDNALYHCSSVFRIRIRMDPFTLLLDPDLVTIGMRIRIHEQL